MAWTQAQNLQDNFNIDTHIDIRPIHNLAHLRYSNVNRSCLTVLDIPLVI